MAFCEYIYTGIGRAFLRGLEDTLLKGDSVVLIGPRYVGKRVILRRIESRLRPKSRVIPLLVPLGARPMSEEDVCRRLLSFAEFRGESVSQPNHISFNAVFEQLVQHVTSPERMVRPTILLVSNVDAMPQLIAREFLRALEPRIEEKTIVTLLTGESDLSQMLGGARSDFRVAHHYFLQGFEQSEFRKHICRHARGFALKFADEAKCANQLYDWSGGNVYQAQQLLRELTLFDKRTRAKVSKRGGLVLDVVSENEIHEAIGKAIGPGGFMSESFGNAARFVWREPSCCDELEALLKDDCLPLDDEASLSPTPLELAGIAVRTRDQGNLQAPRWHLKFSSPLMKEFAQVRFDSVWRGDLYALTSRWNLAVERYKSASEGRRVRPRGTQDSIALDTVVLALCSDLHVRASKARGIQEVDDLFIDACRHLIGFREASVFRLQPDILGRAEWRAVRSDLESSNLELVKNALSHGNTFTEGRFEPIRGDAFVVGIGLDDCFFDERTSVVLSDFAERTIVPRLRNRLLDRIIGHYVTARQHAVSVEADKREADVLQRYHDINKFISDKLRTQCMDINEVLKHLATTVMGLGYRTFGCGFYSRPEKRVLCGIYRNDQEPEPSYGPDWPNKALARENRLAAEEGQPRVSRDARGQEMWFLPLFTPDIEKNREGVVTHTFVVQRTDDAPLRKSEYRDLTQLYGDQLLIALRQSERIILLQSALDEITEPLAIVDPESQLRYVNKAMHKLFPTTPDHGWQESLHAKPIQETLGGAKNTLIVEMLKGSLRGEDKLPIYVLGPAEDKDSGLGNDSTYYGQVSFRHIANTRGRLIGAYAHVQNLHDQLVLDQVTRLVFVADREDVVRDLLLSIDSDKLQWRRYFRVERTDDRVLRGAGAIGTFSQELSEFIEGKVAIPDTKEFTPSWQCFEKRAPMVFQYTQRSGRKTLYGVPIIAVPNPRWSGLLKKEPDEMWFDVPLRAFGKLSMWCDDKITPQTVEFWRVLGDAAGLALENLAREAESKELTALAAERNLLASMAHNIHTRIASLSAVKYRYELYAKRNPSSKLDEINHQFDEFLEAVGSITERAKRQLGALVLEKVRFDLYSSLKRLLAERGLTETSRVTCDQDQVEIFGDKELVVNSFAELLQNSVEAAADSSRLSVHIRLGRFRSAGSDWVRIEYEDNGPGVPDPWKTKIFELFFTHRTNGTRGTGLGLYFAKRVILAHGGTLVENGIFHQGARFLIEIPRGKGD